MSIFQDFTGRFPVSKTLRFSLIPQFNTEENIEKFGLIAEDEERAENYKKVKPLFDRCHKNFIEEVLSGLELDWNKLYDALLDFRRDKEGNEEQLKDAQKECRRKISEAFKKHPLYKETSPNELVKSACGGKKSALFEGLSGDDIALIASFKGFTTYFSGYSQTRENIYKSDIAASVAHRIVMENFPKFIMDIDLYNSLSDEAQARYSEALSDKLCGVSLNDVFSIEFFNRLLSQSGIDMFNDIVGGNSTEDNAKIQGLNEFCNLDSQQNKSKNIKFAPLFKQILSERESFSFILEPFQNDAELLEALQVYIKSIDASDFEWVLSALSGNDIEKSKVFIDENQLKNLSLIINGEWDSISIKLKDANIKKKRIYTLEEVETATSDDVLAKYKETLASSFEEIESARKNLDSIFSCGKIESYDPIKVYLDSVSKSEKLMKIFATSDDADKDSVFYGLFDALYLKLRGLIPIYNKIRNYATKKPYTVEKIKLNFRNPKLASGWVDSITDKSENGTQSHSFLFRKSNGHGYDYYLGVCNNPKVLRECVDGEQSEFERLNYYQLSSKTFFGSSYVGQHSYKENKIAFANIVKSIADKEGLKIFDGLDFSAEEQTPNKLIKIIKDNNVLHIFTNSDDFNSIDNEIKESIRNTLIKLSSKMPAVSKYLKYEYELCTDMILLIDEICKIKAKSYFKISKTEFNSLLNDEKKPLFLFLIANKDFVKKYNKNDTSAKNIHSLYFEQMMSEDSVFDLGTGMLCYRKASKFQAFSHKAGEYVVNRTYSIGDKKFSIPEDIHKELVMYYNGKIKEEELSQKAISLLPVASYHITANEIVKDKRFLQDKYLFHFSTVINPSAIKESKVSIFNKSVNNVLSQSDDYNIIGIDRGERNLLYICCIDKNGRILEQKSLNIINGVDYLEKLTMLADERDSSRKNWHAIGKIKDLKTGYLSFVIHEICEMMLKYNAVLSLEKLNPGFKNSRKHIEQQVYQNFEKALLTKLNYLASKSLPAYAPGGVCNGYQLTTEFTSFDDLKKQRQTGFLYYVPAAYTSKIDFKTGFVNLFTSELLKYSREKSQSFFDTFKNISYNADEDYFEFEFDYSDFKLKTRDYANRWTVCTYGEDRTVYVPTDKNRGSYEHVNVTQRLKELFNSNGIDYTKSLKEQIVTFGKKPFFSTLLWLFRITVQLRYGDKDQDYILSPIKNKDGYFYDTRENRAGEPLDGDANGAYHIALQCLRLTGGIEDGELPKEKGEQNYNWYKFAQTMAEGK